jgi:hypothetical protein
MQQGTVTQRAMATVRYYLLLHNDIIDENTGKLVACRRICQEPLLELG